MKQYPDTSITKRRIFTLCMLGVTVALFTWLTVFLCKRFAAFSDSPEAFKAFVEGFGWKSRLVALGIQMLQVVVSFIPGEFVEVGMGYAFGAVEGTLLCMLGIALASSVIFLLVKTVGVRAVELFISRDNIDRLRFINNESRLKTTVFLLYFIPGTPKDLFTYFVGLTRIRLHEFLILTLLARIPSLISSTVGGNLIQKENYIAAVILFVITGAVSLLGLWLYKRIKNSTKKC